MVQILPRVPSKRESFLESLGSLTGGLAEGGQAIRGALDSRRTRQALSDRFGEEFRNIRDPNIQKLMLQGALQKESAQEKALADELSLPDYETVKSQFGKEFADLYKAVPVGGKTQMIKSALDAMGRGENIRDLLSGEEETPDISRDV